MTTQGLFIGCTEYGIDKMYAELQGKVSCMWLYNATDGEAPAGGKLKQLMELFQSVGQMERVVQRMKLRWFW